jgi:hypothetical protein
LLGLSYSLDTPPLDISVEITRVTGPLTDEGHIDFFKAMEQRFHPPELATNDNGFRIFVHLFGNVWDHGDVEEQDREFYRLQKYKKLGLDSDILPTMTLPVSPCRIVDGFKYDQLWTLEDFPMLADWIQEIDEQMDAIAEMIRKPVFFVPFLQNPGSVESGLPQNLIELILPDVRTFREIGRIFTARAAYRIGQGDIDGGIEDKLTVRRLGRLTAQKGILVPYLVGISIEGMALSIPINANPERPLMETQVYRIIEGLDALPPRPPSYIAYEADRIMGLSAIQYGSIHGEYFAGGVFLDTHVRST